MALERFDDLPSAPALGAWFDALRSVMSNGNPPVRRFAVDQVIMRAGDTADCFLVILEGSATVLGVFDDEPPLAVGAGEVLGELGVLFEGRRRRTVTATSPTVAVAGTRPELEAALQIEAIGSHVANVAARRLAEAIEPIPARTSRGLSVAIRPLLPTDRRFYVDALGHASLDTLRKRFFAARMPPAAVIERLIHIDYVDHVAWVAVDSAGRGLGVARLVVEAEDPGLAEIALGVAESHQGQGLGTLLVGTLGVLAQARGLHTIAAYVLSSNLPMRAVFRKARATSTPQEPGVQAVRMAVADVAGLLDSDTVAKVKEATRQLREVARLADA